jgi:hypothetical protein
MIGQISKMARIIDGQTYPLYLFNAKDGTFNGRKSHAPKTMELNT